jgi:hypothetical protein
MPLRHMTFERELVKTGRPARSDNSPSSAVPPVPQTGLNQHYLAPTTPNFFIGRPSVDPELMIRMLIVGYCRLNHSRR